MRIDIISVFPEYLQPLDLSLIGKARESGLLDLRVHDLREWSSDRHRSVDDSPYGGGPGMVMRPDVWGAALDSVRGSGDVDPELIVPAPTGLPLTQREVRVLAGARWLVIACGRYEGIDARVVDHYRSREDWAAVHEVSLGDYVVAGGEVAALVLVEAIGRLIPGVLGNDASADSDSFSEGYSGLLEAPVYTRPEEWRGLRVPDVLTSGDHGRVAAWRSRESRERTARTRPSLLDPGAD